MTTVVVLTIPAQKMALSEALDRLGDCYLRVEETAFTDADNYLHAWISYDDSAALEDALAADQSVESYSLVTDGDDERLYRLEIQDRMLLPRQVIHNLEGEIMGAYACEGEWTLEVRFPDREDVSKTSDLFDRFGIDVTYESITDLDLDSESLPASLTDRQREVLAMAIDEGYYDIPRQATLEELAQELDVSHQALSECLRRAQRQLAKNQLSPEADPSTADAAR